MLRMQDAPPHTRAPQSFAASAAPAHGAGKIVLVIAQEHFVREILASRLRATGCFPMPVASAEEGRRLAAQMVPDLIVIDLDGAQPYDASWAAQLARSSPGKPVRTVMLSTDTARICGSDGGLCGADLCVPKPFEPRDLTDQLMRLLRPQRTKERRPRIRPPLKAASIELDRHQPTLRLQSGNGWHTLDLPWTEHRLLACLLSDLERVRSREEIRDAVWSDSPVDLRTVDQYVRRLRSTLDAAGARGLVRTVKSVGYRLDLAALSGPRERAADPLP